MKTIVFCADGTWNGPGQPEEQEEQGGRRTNVFKLFLNLAGDLSPDSLRSADEQERIVAGADGKPTQIAKYLHGVGDSKNFLVRVLGGGGGAGLVTRIVRGYTFISRNFEPGDRIFIVGFSRGAYTARALAGLIAARGLLDPTQTDLAGDRAQAYRLGSAEWFTYRRGVLKKHQSLLRTLAEVAVDLPGFLQSPAVAPRIADVPIEGVVVWDTVGSLGIPAYNLKTDTQLDAFQFADLALSRKVCHGLHAVSVDEQRSNFTPNPVGARRSHRPGAVPGRARGRGGRLPG
jgi:glutathione S-transferase